VASPPLLFPPPSHTLLFLFPRRDRNPNPPLFCVLPPAFVLVVLPDFFLLIAPLQPCHWLAEFSLSIGSLFTLRQNREAFAGFLFPPLIFRYHPAMCDCSLFSLSFIFPILRPATPPCGCVPLVLVPPAFAVSTYDHLFFEWFTTVISRAGFFGTTLFKGKG